MLGPNTPDYDFYWTLFKGDYSKGVDALKGILGSKELTAELASNVGGMEVIFGVEDGNSKELLSALGDSISYENVVTSYLKSFGIDASSVDELLSDDDKLSQSVECGAISKLMSIPKFVDAMTESESAMRAVGSNAEASLLAMSSVEIFRKFSESPHYSDMVSGAGFANAVSSMSEMRFCAMVRLLAPQITASTVCIDMYDFLNTNYSTVNQSDRAVELLCLHPKFIHYLRLQSGWVSSFANSAKFREYLLANPDDMKALILGMGEGNAGVAKSLFDNTMFLPELLGNEEAFETVFSDYGCVQCMSGLSDANVAKSISKALDVTPALTTTAALMSNAEAWAKVKASKPCRRVITFASGCMSSFITRPNEAADYFTDPEILAECRSIGRFDEYFRSITTANEHTLVCKVAGIDSPTTSNMSQLMGNSEYRQKVAGSDAARQAVFYSTQAMSPLQGDPTYMADFAVDAEMVGDGLSHYAYWNAVWGMSDANMTTLLKAKVDESGSYTSADEFLGHQDFIDKVVDAEDRTAALLCANNSTYQTRVCYSSVTDQVDKSLAAWFKSEDMGPLLHTMEWTTPSYYQSLTDARCVKLIHALASIGESSHTAITQIVSDADEWGQVIANEDALRAFYWCQPSMQSVFGDSTYIQAVCKDDASWRKIVATRIFGQNVMSNSTYISQFGTALNQMQRPEVAVAVLETEAWDLILKHSYGTFFNYINSYEWFWRPLAGNVGALKKMSSMNSSQSYVHYFFNQTNFCDLAMSNREYVRWLFSMPDHNCRDMMNAWLGSNTSWNTAKSRVQYNMAFCDALGEACWYYFQAMNSAGSSYITQEINSKTAEYLDSHLPAVLAAIRFSNQTYGSALIQYTDTKAAGRNLLSTLEAAVGVELQSREMTVGGAAPGAFQYTNPNGAIFRPISCRALLTCNFQTNSYGAPTAVTGRTLHSCTAGGSYEFTGTEWGSYIIGGTNTSTASGKCSIDVVEYSLSED